MTLPHHFFTTSGGKLPETPNPVVLYHRAHERQEESDRRGNWLGKWRRPEGFLKRVLRDVNSVCSKHYESWFTRFESACESVTSPDQSIVLELITVWRLVIGWSSNPALESGLDLHPLLGFPLLPGSAAKGLLHHTLEMALMEESETDKGDVLPKDCLVDLTSEPPAALSAFLIRAEAVRALCGSLALERGVAEDGADFGPVTPREGLGVWRDKIQQALGAVETEEVKSMAASATRWSEKLDRIRILLDEPTGGLLTCFDAVPDRKSFGSAGAVLCTDVLTPHHSAYYSGRGLLPVDSESPNAIQFLAVAPGVTFVFRLRLIWPDCDERVEALERAGWDHDEVKRRVEIALSDALANVGIGAKTASGYGYLAATPPTLTLDPIPGRRASRPVRRNGSRGRRPARRGVDVGTNEQPREKPKKTGYPPGPRDAPAVHVTRLLFQAKQFQGGIESLVDGDAKNLGEVEQRLLAAAIRTDHADRIQSWLDKAKKGKETAARRLRWLEKFAPEGADVPEDEKP